MEADKEIKVRRVPIQEEPTPEPTPDNKAGQEKDNAPAYPQADEEPEGIAPGAPSYKQFEDRAAGRMFVRRTIDGTMVYMDTDTGSMRVFKDGEYQVEAGRREKLDLLVEPGMSQMQMSDGVDGIQIAVQNSGRRTVSVVVELREV